MPDGRPCNCGGRGHLESYTGGTNISKIYGSKAENIKDEKIWDETAKYLAAGLNNLTVLWDPDIIILGGGVAKSIPLEITEIYLKDLLKIYPRTPRLAKAALGTDAGLYGALELIRC